MSVKKFLKAALYAGIVGAFAFGCGTDGGVVDEDIDRPDDGRQGSWNGLLAQTSGLTQHQGSIPAGTCDLISEISMGSVIISGGSSTIAIGSLDPINKLYISFSSEPNVYYELALTEDVYLGYVGGVYLYTPVIYVSQGSSSMRNGENVTVKLVVQSPSCGRSQATNRNVTTQVVGSGNLQLALSWNSTADVDLHVKLPGGQHAYWSNKLVKNSSGDTLVRLDMDANAICGNDVRNENMYFRTLVNGLYLVYLHLFDRCTSTGAGTEFTLTATAGGRILGSSYLNKTRGNFGNDEHQVLGVITVRNGAVVTTDYTASDVRTLMQSTLLKKLEEKK